MFLRRSRQFQTFMVGFQPIPQGWGKKFSIGRVIADALGVIIAIILYDYLPRLSLESSLIKDSRPRS